MNIEFSFSKQISDCSTEHVFDRFYKWFKENNLNHNVTHNDNSINKKGAFMSHLSIVKNLDNGKYITISYWDRAFDILIPTIFEPEKCMNIITSSGVHEDKTGQWGDYYRDVRITPFTYVPYVLYFEKYISDKLIPFNNKDNNELLFRGYLYHNRKEMNKISPNNFTEGRLSSTNYYNELNRMKICLSLDGAGLTCHRDMEILGVGSVLLRPELSQKFHNPLIPNFHYVSVDNVTDPILQWKLLVDKFKEIKSDYDFLKYISSNGKKWFEENGTVDVNVNILKNLVKIEDLL